MATAQIRPANRNSGVNVYVNGGYWQWFETYDDAVLECNRKGYKVYG